MDSRRRLHDLAIEHYGPQSDGELNPFVITSYNYGAAGMRRALASIGPDFMDVLERYRSPSFRVAVKNFYASFLAARHVARNADRYFGGVRALSPLRYDTVVLERPTSLTRIRKVFRVTDEELKTLNPALTRFAWHEWRLIPSGYRLRLPPRDGGRSAQAASLNALPPESEAMNSVNYTVKRGDTACGVARAFRVSCRELISANGLGKRAVIRVGQSLLIPGRRGGGSAASTGSVTQGQYRVRRGDTACGIATEVGVDCRQLIAHNRLGSGELIHVGQTLDIPGSGSVAPTSGAATRATIVNTARADITWAMVQPNSCMKGPANTPMV